MISLYCKSKVAVYIVPSPKFFSEGYRGRVMHALGVAEGLAENGFDVVLIGGKGLSYFKKDVPDRVFFVELEPLSGPLTSFRWRLLLLRAAIRAIRERVPEVSIVRYAVASAPFIWFLTILHSRGTKKILEVNSFAYHMTASLPAWVNRSIARAEIALVNRFDGLYVVSEAMSRDHRNKGCRVPIAVIPNGATSKEVTVKARGNGQEVQRRLVYIGTMMPYWDFQFLAKAINYLHTMRRVTFVFCGGGPMQVFLKSALARHELIKFLGPFNRNNLGSLVDPANDIFVLPPKTKDDMVLTGGLSTKLFDYLSMGAPILAPADGEIKSILKDGSNSALYSSSDEASFAKSACRILDDVAFREKISSQARSDFVERYSWKSRMRELLEKLA